MQNQRLRPGVCQKRFHIAKRGPPLRKRYEPKNAFYAAFCEVLSILFKGKLNFPFAKFYKSSGGCRNGT